MDSEKQDAMLKKRREFIKTAVIGGLGISQLIGCSTSRGLYGSKRTVNTGMTGRRIFHEGPSTVSLAAGRDQRKAAFDALKPLQHEIERAINGRQVVIKVNMGQVSEQWWLNATDVNFTRGILDFLKLFYDRTVIVAESTAAGAQSTMVGFENFNYLPLENEYKVKLVDLNDMTTTRLWISDIKGHPAAVDIIDTFLDPDVYIISATRLKQHNCVVVTLSMKNITMAAPVNRYRQKERANRNQKPVIHAIVEGASYQHSQHLRKLSQNMFKLAYMGIQPDLAVLDGIVGMEGDGPVRGTAVEGEIVLASTDWVAADRIGTELMGNDYNEVKYLKWCGEAGMGNDDISKMRFIGPNYHDYVINYKLSPLIDQQREWIKEDFLS